MKPIAVFHHSPGKGPRYFATFLDRHSLPWQLIRLDEGGPTGICDDLRRRPKPPAG